MIGGQKNSDTFFGNRLKLVQNGSVRPIVSIHHQLWLKWSLPTKNEHNWTEIVDLVTETMIGGQKISDSFFGNRLKLVQNGSVRPIV